MTLKAFLFQTEGTVSNINLGQEAKTQHNNKKNAVISITTIKTVLLSVANKLILPSVVAY